MKPWKVLGIVGAVVATLFALFLVVGLIVYLNSTPEEREHHSSPKPTTTVTVTVTPPPPAPVTETATVTAPPVTITETVSIGAPAATQELARQPQVRPVPNQAPDKPSTSVYYANCTEARAAGAAPIRRGEPGYRSALDRDNDGTACDS